MNFNYKISCSNCWSMALHHIHMKFKLQLKTCFIKIQTGDREIAQQFRALGAIARGLDFWSHHLHGESQPCINPVPRDPMPSDFWDIRYTYAHAGKNTHTETKIRKSNLLHSWQLLKCKIKYKENVDSNVGLSMVISGDLLLLTKSDC